MKESRATVRIPDFYGQTRGGGRTGVAACLV